MNKLNDLLELLKSVLRALLNPIGSSSILKIVFYNIAPTPSKYIYTFLQLHVELNEFGGCGEYAYFCGSGGIEPGKNKNSGVDEDVENYRGKLLKNINSSRRI